MPTFDSSYELRRRAAIARRIANDVLNPLDKTALRQMANDLEAEAERIEQSEGATGDC